VGIHLNKSLTSTISVYAILKAGACYVPLNPSTPGERIANVVRQCAMRALITSADIATGKLVDFPADIPLRTIFFTDSIPDVQPPERTAFLNCEEVLEPQSAAALPTAGTDQDLAYVLFTSGSTGEPKGVMLSHLNALTFVNWSHATFGLTAEDRLSNHAPLNFDLSVFDVFAAARAGASVHLIPEMLSLFPTRLAEWVERQQISVWYSVPSVLRLLLTHGRIAERDLHQLRLILFAGEVFPNKFLAELMRVLPRARYFNLYGPTETNVCSYYEVTTPPDPAGPPIPIGKACENTDLIALDAEGRRVTKLGHEGLLYARGSAVMQGYYGRPAETAASFIPNPFASGREEKLYATGDWVTLDDRGDYLFIGRRDHMVKIRGYRIELGEVEAVLYRHPAVREAVAVPVADENLGNRLEAFIVIDSSADITAQDLRQHCARFLPKYVVPDVVEFRDSLPRTTTDKIDRSRLKAEAARCVNDHQ
jgi:amino acid adenylation domain-containing protein